jgi:hypothetical protein
MSSYPFLPAIRPQSVGSKVYFMAPRTSYGMVYELEVDRVTATASADDMSAAVPSYVPNTVDIVASCSSGFMVAYAESGAREVYFHLFRYSQGQRIQNAWQRSFLPNGWTVGGMFFKGTQLHLLAVNGSEAHLVMADVSPSQVDDGAGAQLLTYWDLRVKESQLAAPTYDAALDTTSYALPYALVEAPHASVRAPGGVDKPEGLVVEVASWTVGGGVTVSGDWRGVPLWFGLAYEGRWEPSTIYVMGQDDRPRFDGRLQLNRMRVDLSGTGYVRVEVTNRGRAVRKTAFEGVRADDPASFTDKAPSYTGQFSVPISGQNIQTSIAFVNDSHFASGVVGFEWLGEFTARSGRV